MRRSFVLVALAFGAAAFCGGAFAADAAAWIGAVRSHRSLEHFDMSVGVTASQQMRRAVRFDEDREVYVVPSHYGTLVAVTSGTDTTASSVLWFKDDSGAVRNAVVPNAASTPYKIVSGATSRFEVELRDQ